MVLPFDCSKKGLIGALIGMNALLKPLNFTLSRSASILRSVILGKDTAYPSFGDPRQGYGLSFLVVMVENFWYHLRKRMPLYLGPLIAAGIIFIDWNHTREWKRNGRVSVLDMHLLNKGPPDTLDCDKQQH
ncbi:unnamed protein product [Toxocara canis]|uniref:DUF4220 domain-containing protein n=1 Tax=Toxocara canis TaxID=6265 RepID=A0A183V5E3_TOXCA|nr:unnamed protein product [Toxocara canis]